MTYPKTVWEYSKLTEAVRIFQTAHNIKNQFYQEKGFYVLPYLVAKNPRVIYFPKIPYQKINDFWKKVEKDSETLLRKKDSVFEEIIHYLPDKELDYSEIKKGWQKVEKQFWQYVFNNFSLLFKNVKVLEIRPTGYGSIATAYSTWLDHCEKIVIYVRNDADYSHIAEAIFIDRIYKNCPIVNEKWWEEREILIDFLLTETPLSKLFPNYSPTANALNQKQEGRFFKESKEYLKYLGFCKKEIFTVVDKKIYYNGKPLIPYFLSRNERKLLRFLIEKKNEVVSFDEIGEVLWGEEIDNKFSLYAIAKLVQRLREKIKSLGVFPEIIQTVKKEGYVLME